MRACNINNKKGRSKNRKWRARWKQTWLRFCLVIEVYMVCVEKVPFVVLVFTCLDFRKLVNAATQLSDYALFKPNLLFHYEIEIPGLVLIRRNQFLQ